MLDAITGSQLHEIDFIWEQYPGENGDVSIQSFEDNHYIITSRGLYSDDKTNLSRNWKMNGTFRNQFKIDKTTGKLYAFDGYNALCYKILD